MSDWRTSTWRSTRSTWRGSNVGNPDMKTHIRAIATIAALAATLALARAEVGGDVRAPGGAVVIDGAGLTVYPGLVDMGTPAGLDVTVSQTPPANQRTTEEAERWKRSVIF